MARDVMITVEMDDGRMVEAKVRELGAWGVDVIRRLVLEAHYVDTQLSVPAEVKQTLVERFNADLR